ncbi:hypothetical protein [Domibacillus aminovorans]|uniref:Replication terminator protein n=1 Tax=Domibacillus aminovorans TaxID=29332 RepID=A0A177KYU9_9BACI|nr:hypothetical protein [Domibacillus aminovorans]OAH58589.1 hypothetical protein AWH49_18750 [Domibacillus aminovorans]
MTKQSIDLNTLAEGGMAEQVGIEMQKVYENIADPNTDWKKKRTITVKLTFEADKKRDLAYVDVETKSSLAPMQSVGTKVIIGRDEVGDVQGAELKSGVPGQLFIDNDGDIAKDTGEKVGEEDSPPPAAEKEGESSKIRRVNFN